jgi:hypothetical protein
MLECAILTIVITGNMQADEVEQNAKELGTELCT